MKKKIEDCTVRELLHGNNGIGMCAKGMYCTNCHLYTLCSQLHLDSVLKTEIEVTDIDVRNLPQQQGCEYCGKVEVRYDTQEPCYHDCSYCTKDVCRFKYLTPNYCPMCGGKLEVNDV